MIPLDTVKTRLVTQTVQAGVVPYKGVLQTLSRVVREEGLGPIYRSLTPRLVSVVPMIGIQVSYRCMYRHTVDCLEKGPRGGVFDGSSSCCLIGVDLCFGALDLFSRVACPPLVCL